ncbi:MAG: GAF domain-containing sensor histidine kinase [Elusimicrobia bacterium]|nr:GAF domain-containing sensor histidine kinase [Elusimicrobiota bacterium]
MKTKQNVGIKLSFCILVFLILIIVTHIFAKNIESNVLLILFCLVISILGYSLIFRPVKLLEKMLNNALDGDYSQGGEPAVFNKVGYDLNSLLHRLMISQESLNILFAASKTITSRTEIDDVINMLLDLVYDKMMMSLASVTFQDSDGILRIKASRGFSEDFIQNIHLAAGEGFCGRSFSSKETIIVNDTAKEKNPATEKIVSQEGIVSFVHIPIIVNDKSIGILSVASKTKNFFDAGIVKTLTTLTNYLAIAIGNSKMYQEIQEFNKRLELEVESTTEELMNTNLRLISKVKEMKALNDIIFSANSKSEIEEIFSSVIEKIKISSNTSIVGFMIYNDLDTLVGYGDLKGFDLKVSDNNGSVLVKTFKEVTSYVSNELFVETAPDLQNLYKNYKVTALVALPLLEKKVIGLFVLGNKMVGKFSHEDIRFLSIIASQIAELICRAKLYEQVNQRVSELTTLRDISDTIRTEPQLEEIIEIIAEKTMKVLGSDYAVCWLLDETGEKLVPKFPLDYAGIQKMNLNIKSPSVIVKSFLEGKVQSFENLEFQNELEELQKTFKINSYLSVPLKVENKKIGLFCFCSTEHNFFKEEKVRIAELIGSQIAVIVENARIHSQLKEFNIKLERLNKVKDDFVAMVSHELRTPLTAIKGFVHVVCDGEAGPVNEQQKKFLGIAKQSIDHLNILISDLLDLSKIESGLITLKLERVNLSDIAKKSVITNTSLVQSKGIDLKVDIDNDLPEIDADHLRLLQVYNNLISNAIKFSNINGKINVVVKDKGDYIISSVSDRGIGIPKEEHQKIFDKFYQVDSSPTRAASGTGLGLFIVKTVIELHGGKIWIDSDLGQGSTFSFLLPKQKKLSRRKHVQNISGG